MRKLTLALLALFVAFPALAATTKVTLNSTTWTDLGVGPAIVAGSGAVVFSVDSTTPTIAVGTGFPMGAGTVCLNTTLHVYAMAVAGNTFPAFVFVSPIVGC
jgi:hypothetical protein